MKTRQTSDSEIKEQDERLYKDLTPRKLNIHVKHFILASLILTKLFFNACYTQS